MFGNRMGGSLAGFGQPRSRAQTLQEHAMALQEHKAELGRRPALHAPNFAPRKPASLFPRPLRLDTCSPLRIADLELGATHGGAVLRGRLVTDAIKMQSVQSMLEDEAGDVVTVHIYNVPCLPATTTTLEDLEAAQALFPQGQALAVLEPFYKLMLDGTRGIRVDNPAEVLFLDAEGRPTGTAADLRVARQADPGPSAPTRKSARPNKSKKAAGSKKPGKRR